MYITSSDHIDSVFVPSAPALAARGLALRLPGLHHLLREVPPSGSQCSGQVQSLHPRDWLPHLSRKARMKRICEHSSYCRSDTNSLLLRPSGAYLANFDLCTFTVHVLHLDSGTRRPVSRGQFHVLYSDVSEEVVSFMILHLQMRCQPAADRRS